MRNRKLRLVLECAKVIVELARLAIVLLNMAINYVSLPQTSDRASQVV